MSFNKKITTKEFYNIELINVAEWYSQSRQTDRNKFNSLPFQVQLALRTNIKEIGKTYESFMEMKRDLLQSLGDKYVADGKTEEVEENGQKNVNVKEEFREEYQNELAECDKKLQEVLRDKTQVTITTFDMDSMYETLPDDCGLNMDDIEMLSFMDKVDDEEDKKYNGGRVISLSQKGVILLGTIRKFACYRIE